MVGFQHIHKNCILNKANIFKEPGKKKMTVKRGEKLKGRLKSYVIKIKIELREHLMKGTMNRKGG
jgi:hypothetical protein